MIAALSTRSNKKIFACETSRKSAMSRAKIAPAAARSDAVRGCSAYASPAARRSCVVASRPGPSVWCDLVLSTCTPARFSAGNWDAHGWRRDGFGGAVTAATDLQPLRNRVILVNQCVSGTVTRLQSGASRHVRVRTYAGTRAYRGGEKSVTLQPYVYLSDIAGYSGYRAVADRLRLQPGMSQGAPIRGKSGDFNIIDGGYAGAGCASIWSIRGQTEGRAAKSFGAGSRGAGRSVGPWRSIGQGAALVGRNGGFLRVCGGRSGRVGTVLLERLAKSGGNAGLSCCRRKLCRLTSGDAGRCLGASVGQIGRGACAVAGGGWPPQSHGAPSSAPWRTPFSGFGSGLDRPISMPAILTHRGWRQSWNGLTGSGESASRSSRRVRPGRGVIARCGLRRSSYRSGRGCHVN